MPQITKLRLLTAGGDLRQTAAAAKLSASTAVCGLGIGALPAGVTDADAAPDTVFDALILPLPAAPDGVHIHAPQSSEPLYLHDVLRRIRPGGNVLGGMLTAETRQAIAEAGLKPVDYAAADAFAVRNAVPTAEAAIEIALRELPVTLHGLHCVILGAGRVSQALQTRLHALGAAVTVAARRSADLARSEGREGKPQWGNPLYNVPFKTLQCHFRSCTFSSQGKENAENHTRLSACIVNIIGSTFPFTGWNRRRRQPAAAAPASQPRMQPPSPP